MAQFSLVCWFVLCHGILGQDEISKPWLEYLRLRFSGGAVAKVHPKASRSAAAPFCFVPAVDQRHRDYLSLFGPVLVEQGITPCKLTSTAPVEVRFVLFAASVAGVRRSGNRIVKKVPTPLESLGPLVAREMTARRVAVLQVGGLMPLASKGGLAMLLLAAFGPEEAWQIMPKTAVVHAGESEGGLERLLKGFGFEALQQGHLLVLKGPARAAQAAASSQALLQEGSSSTSSGSSGGESSHSGLRSGSAGKRGGGGGGGLVFWGVPPSGEGWGYGTSAMLSEQLRSSFCGGGSPSATRVSRGVGLDCAPPLHRYGGRSIGAQEGREDGSLFESWSESSPGFKGRTGGGGGVKQQQRLGPEIVLQRIVQQPFLMDECKVSARVLLLLLPSSSIAKRSQERSKLFHDFGQWVVGSSPGDPLASVSAAVAADAHGVVGGTTTNNNNATSSSTPRSASSRGFGSQFLTAPRVGHHRASLTKLSEYVAEHPESLTAAGWDRLGVAQIPFTTAAARSSSLMSDHSNKRSGSSSSSKGRSAASVRNGAKEEEEAAAVVKREQLEKEVKEALVAEWGRTMSSLLGVLHKVVRGTPHGQVAFMSADLVLDRHGKFWLVDMNLLPPMPVSGPRSENRRAMFRSKVKDVVALADSWAKGEALQTRMCPESAVLAADKKGGGPGAGKCLLEFTEAPWPSGVDPAQAMHSTLSDVSALRTGNADVPEAEQPEGGKRNPRTIQRHELPLSIQWD